MLKRELFKKCKELFEILIQTEKVSKEELMVKLKIGEEDLDELVTIILFAQSQPMLIVKEENEKTILKLKRQADDNTIYPETEEALKAMQKYLKNIEKVLNS